MADHTAFFYGTLMAPKILHRVIFGTTTPQAHQTQFLTIRPALLPSHRRHRVKRVDYPGVIPAAGSSVLGTYVTGLTPQDVRRLDYFEGGEYERRDVRVRVLRGGVGDGDADGKGDAEVQTQTYIYLDEANLEDGEWDFEEFKREKMGAWTLEDSEEYHDIPFDADGTGGRGAGGDITRQLDEERGDAASEAVRAAV